MKKQNDIELPVETSEQTDLIPLNVQTEMDFEEARATYKYLVEKGKRSLDIAMDILEGSEHPRAIEVFSGLMRSIADVEEKVLNLHQLKQSIQKGTPRPMIPEGTTITQNNITVGSTQDILNAFKSIEEDND